METRPAKDEEVAKAVEEAHKKYDVALKRLAAFEESERSRVKIVEGNLLDAEENIIAHQVNCTGAMNSGVAKVVRNKYPKVFEEYKKYVYAQEHKDRLLGACQLIDVGVDKCVANLFGQAAYGYDGRQYTSVPALKKSLESLKAFAEQNGLSVALPYGIGSVRGGAKWEDVLDVISEVFNDYPVTLYRLDLG